ncbi:MAG: hypothetical protein KHY27_00405 [Butyricicoccus pullicaecorum]|nr:hypothetical protein [Butyricicoccus pullicaecorum]
MNYSYHGRIKQHIKAGELTDVQFVTDYPRIGECMVLMFKTEPISGLFDRASMQSTPGF